MARRIATRLPGNMVAAPGVVLGDLVARLLEVLVEVEGLDAARDLEEAIAVAVIDKVDGIGGPSDFVQFVLRRPGLVVDQTTKKQQRMVERNEWIIAYAFLSAIRCCLAALGTPRPAAP